MNKAKKRIPRRKPKKTKKRVVRRRLLIPRVLPTPYLNTNISLNILDWNRAAVVQQLQQRDHQQDAHVHGGHYHNRQQHAHDATQFLRRYVSPSVYDRQKLHTPVKLEMEEQKE